MSTSTVMWLLLAVFMIHDFEEIIMFHIWWNKNQAELKRHFPAWVGRTAEHTVALSTPSFALMVAVLFTALTVFTVICVEGHWYSLWTGLLLFFFIHTLAHIGQWIAWRGYVPVIATSIPAAIYSMYALAYMLRAENLAWADILSSLLACLLLFTVVFALALWTGKRFERWLQATEAST